MGHFSCLFCSDWWGGSSLRPLVRAVVPLWSALEIHSESTYVSCSPRWWSWSSSNHRWARSPHKPIPEGSFILFLQLNLKLPPLCEAWPDTNRGCTCVWARSSLQTDTASLSASFYPQCMLAFHASLSCELSSVCLYKHCWPVTHPLPAAMLYREPKVKKRPLMELQCENRLGLASRERSLWSCGFLLFGYYNKQLVRPVWIFSNKIPSHLVLSLCKQSVQHSETAAYLQLKVW